MALLGMDFLGTAFFALWIAVLLGIGFAVGWWIGRWWACLVAVALGVLMTLGDPGWETPDWFFGAFYGGITALGIAMGVSLRKQQTGSKASASRRVAR